MDPGDLEKLLKQAIKKVLSKDSMKEYGDKTVDRIRTRVRLGYGVGDINEPSRQKKLKRLSDSYRAWRKRNKSKLDSTTTVNRSNLTQTGEMLRDMSVKVRGDRFEIYFTKSFSRKKAEWNTPARPFMQLTTSEKNLLIEEVRNDIISFVKGRLK